MIENQSVNIYQDGLRVSYLHSSQIIGRIESLAELFLEWFLFDCSEPQSIQDFLVDNQITDLFAPDDFLAVIFGDAYLEDRLCELVCKILPFSVLHDTIFKLNYSASIGAKFMCCAEEGVNKHFELLKQEKAQKDKERYHKYYENNKDKIMERHRKYYANNKSKITERMRQSYIINREKILEQQRVYYMQNRDEILARNKIYREVNKEKIVATQKLYYINHKSDIAEYKHAYREKNKERIAEYKREYREANKEKIAQKKKEYRLENIEKISQHKHEYYLDNKDEILSKNKIYREANKEKIAQNKKEYRIKNREKLILQKKEHYQKRLDEYMQKCPVAQFVEYIRQNNLAEFNMYYTARTRGASICLSLCKQGVKNCPLCANDLTDEQMRATCPVVSVFNLENAYERIRAFVKDIKNNELQHG